MTLEGDNTLSKTFVYIILVLLVKIRIRQLKNSEQ
jgi:hypothetical protein